MSSCILDCGQGTCINNSCICKPDWSQSLDFSFFIDKRFSFVNNETSFSRLPCDQHLGTIKILYYLALSLIILSVLENLFSLRNLRQLKRAIPFLFASAVGLSGLLYKVQNLQGSVFYGIDYFFTLTMITSSTLGNLAFLVFIQKYIRWESKMINDSEEQIRLLHRFRLSQKVVLFIIILTPVTTLLLLNFDKRRISLSIAYIGYSMVFVTLCYVIYGADYFIRRVITSLETNFQKNISEEKSILAKKYARNMKILRACYVIQGTTLAIGNIIALTSFKGMNSWKYILPSYYILYSLLAFITVFVYNERKISKFVYGFRGNKTKRGSSTGKVTSENVVVDSSIDKDKLDVSIDPDYVDVGPSLNTSYIQRATGSSSRKLRS
eukprot:snap_masked-scaffold_2-processed-gene-23.27-mRNA-1 protein AED:1.00 eAED:1.00 QI:0/-1/0/0/-1/1/1/0/380